MHLEGLLEFRYSLNLFCVVMTNKLYSIHHEVTDTLDILTLVNVCREADLFKPQAGRQFSAFPNFSRDLFVKLGYEGYCKWIKNKLKEWKNVHI